MDNKLLRKLQNQDNAIKVQKAEDYTQALETTLGPSFDYSLDYYMRGNAPSAKDITASVEPSQRMLGPDGLLVKWTFRSLSGNEIRDCRLVAEEKVFNNETKQVDRIFSHYDFFDAVFDASLVEPSLADPQVAHSYGVATAHQVALELLTEREYDELVNFAVRLSNPELGDDPEDAVEAAKN